MEHRRSAAVTFHSIPAFSRLQRQEKLPDPFRFLDGTRMTGKDQWPARRDEIKTMAERFQYGAKPPRPESVTGSFRDNRLTVTIRQGDRTISFAAPIRHPKSGTDPFPAIIGIGTSHLNNEVLLDWGVAIIDFPQNEIADQTNAAARGKGLFYDLHGKDHSAGSLMAWAWGVSCLIDALEMTPEANIDPSRLGVTGCSRNGKGALAAGAWDERIALTIPQEPGAGGSSSWRINERLKQAGRNIQTLSHIVTENTWFTDSFSQFGEDVDKLPFDMHMIQALVAPRALLVLDNPDYEWLGPSSSYQTAHVARVVWETLGAADRFGFSQLGGCNHCSLPDAQLPILAAFVRKFLLGPGDENSGTNVLQTDRDYTFDRNEWVDWTAPF